MDFITGAINDVLDKAERDATAKFDELTGVTHQQGAEIAKQLCLIRAELVGIRMAIVTPRRRAVKVRGTPPKREGPMPQRGVGPWIVANPHCSRPQVELIEACKV